MEGNFLYDSGNVSYAERESFNNAILLLSMIKREYYYIVGFSRLQNIIRIGFDFENRILGIMTETITVDFCSSSDHIQVYSQLSNIYFENRSVIPFAHKGHFRISEGYVLYERSFNKDSVLPMSMSSLNSIILLIKRDIREFICAGIECLTNPSGDRYDNIRKDL